MDENRLRLGMRREESEAIRTVTEMNIEERKPKKKWEIGPNGGLGRGRPQIDKGEGDDDGD